MDWRTNPGSEHRNLSAAVYCGRFPRAWDRELVAQDDQLEVSLTAAADEHTNETTENPVDASPRHPV